MTDQMVGFADVLHQRANDGAVVIATQKQVTEEGSHERHIGDVLQEDGRVSSGKHHCTI